MNYYERHLGDYAKDTAHLDMIEHGAYTLLLDRCYGSEQGIPDDQVMRVSRAKSKDEIKAVESVLREFFILTNGVWTNKRASEEIEKTQAKIKSAKENGRRGGRPKNNPTVTQPKPNPFDSVIKNITQPKPNPFENDKLNESGMKAHQSPVTSHQTIPTFGGMQTPSQESRIDLETGEVMSWAN